MLDIGFICIQFGVIITVSAGTGDPRIKSILSHKHRLVPVDPPLFLCAIQNVVRMNGGVLFRALKGKTDGHLSGSYCSRFLALAGG